MDTQEDAADRLHAAVAGRPHPAPRPPAAGAVALQRVRRLRVRRLLRLAHPYRLHGVLGADGRAARATARRHAACLRGVARPPASRRPRGHRADWWRPSCRRAACTATSTACGATTAPTSTCAIVAWCSRTRTARRPHMVGAIRDITHELEARAGPAEAAELYRTLFENAVNPTYLIDGDGRFVDANAAGVLFLETSRAQLLRHGVGEVWGRAAHSPRCATRRRRAPPPRSSWSSSWAAPSRRSRSHWCPCRYRGATTCFALGHGHQRPPHPAHWPWRSRRRRCGVRRTPSRTATRRCA